MRLIFINLPVAVTLLGLVFSLSACIYALTGNIGLSMICFMISGLCDLFDGYLARKLNRTELQNQFGLHIDTVVDMASFGVTPVIIAICIGLSPDLLGNGIFIFYAVCAALRLSYFNVLGTTQDHPKSYYVGLPVTFIALLFPLFYVVSMQWIGFIHIVHIQAFFLVVALLFISRIPVPKPKGAFYIIFPALFGTVTTYLYIKGL
jgi:CDP-diacylglycerol---serine O-phosphatidyltransferase